MDKLPLNLGLFRGSASLPVKGVSFGLNIELYNQLQRNEVDPFVLLMDILRKIKEKRQPILILDEVQTLQDIYMNGEIKKKHLFLYQGSVRLNISLLVKDLNTVLV
jgi:hypothetical protein